MKFTVRDLIWLTLVAGMGLGWFRSVHEAANDRRDLVSLRGKLKNAAASLESSEDEIDAAKESRRQLLLEFAKYRLIHPEAEPETATVTVERKIYDSLWAEHTFLMREFNPQSLRVNFHYHEGEVVGYSMGGILPRRRVIPTDD
jgi:hypothetical protein